MSPIPREERERSLSRSSIKRMLAVIIIMTTLYSLTFASVIGLDTPEKSVAVFGLTIMFLMISTASAVTAELVISRRKARALEEMPVLPPDQRLRPSLVGFHASGRGWKMAAALMSLSILALSYVVGPLSDIYLKAGFPEAFRWIFAALFPMCVVAAYSFLKKRSITVDGVGVRCEGRLVRNFSILWTQVAKIEWIDISIFFLGGRGKHPVRNYIFRNAEGKMLGFINPQNELKASDAQGIERALIEQAAAHKIETVMH
jgi:hypothetical protein